MAKISPMLSKLLNDVEVDFPAVSDSEIIKANEELTNTMAEAKESSTDAEMLSEAISDLEVAKEDIAAGLESGIDHVSAKLLMANLNNCIKRVDSEGVVSLAGLQSDNVSYTLQAGLLAADGIIKKGIEVLKALWKKIVDGITFVWDAIKKFFAWIFGSAKKTSEDLSDLSETFDEVDEIITDIVDLPKEQKEEIFKNAKRKAGFKIPDEDPSDNSKIDSSIFNMFDQSNDGAKDRFKKRTAEKTERSKKMAEVIITGVVLNEEEFTKEILGKKKKQMIFELTQKHFLINASKIFESIVSNVLVGLTIDNKFNLKSLYKDDYILASSTLLGFPYEEGEKMPNIESLRGAISKELADKVKEAAEKLYTTGEVDHLVSGKSDFLNKNVLAKLENIESYADQVENVLNNKAEFNYSILSKNKTDGLFLICSKFVQVREKNNFKNPSVSFDALIGNSFTGGRQDGIRTSDSMNLVVHDLSAYNYMENKSYIKQLEAGFAKYAKGIGESKAAAEKILSKHKEVKDKIDKLVSIVEKGGVATGEKKGTDTQYKFISGISEIVQNLSKIGLSVSLYTQGVAAPQTIVSLMLSALDKKEMDAWIEKELNK